MSFIKIENEEKNVFKFLHQLSDEKLTIDMCEAILSKTNAFQVTRLMLSCIDKLDINEKKEYKDVIVAMFDRRVQRKQEKDFALYIAKECGFEKELNECIEYTGNVGYQPKMGASEKVLVVDDWLNYYDNICSYDVVMVVGEVECFRCSSQLEGVVDLRGAKNIDFTFCNLSAVEDIKFDEKNFVNMKRAILPKSLDVSQCGHIYIGWNTDMSNVEMIKFRDKEQMLNAELSEQWDSEGKIVYLYDKEVEKCEEKIEKYESDVEIKQNEKEKQHQNKNENLLQKIRDRFWGRW